MLIELPRIANGSYPQIGPLTPELAEQAENATIFGAPLSGTFMRADGNWHIQVVTVVLIIAMSATTFLTQRQLTMKNMPPAALQGPMAQQQKVLLYVLPLIFAFSGVNFPIGVLIYWTTTNLWSMGQQFYTIRRMPAPGSQAEIAMKERKAKKAKAHGVIEEDAAAPVIIEEKPRGQREQPKRKDRNKPRPVIEEIQDKPAAPKPATPRPASSKPGSPKPAAPKDGDGPGTPAPGKPTKPKK